MTAVHNAAHENVEDRFGTPIAVGDAPKAIRVAFVLPIGFNPSSCAMRNARRALTSCRRATSNLFTCKPLDGARWLLMDEFAQKERPRFQSQLRFEALEQRSLPSSVALTAPPAMLSALETSPAASALRADLGLATRAAHAIAEVDSPALFALLHVPKVEAGAGLPAGLGGLPHQEGDAAAAVLVNSARTYVTAVHAGISESVAALPRILTIASEVARYLDSRAGTWELDRGESRTGREGAARLSAPGPLTRAAAPVTPQVHSNVPHHPKALPSAESQTVAIAVEYAVAVPFSGQAGSVSVAAMDNARAPRAVAAALERDPVAAPEQALDEADSESPTVVTALDLPLAGMLPFDVEAIERGARELLDRLAEQIISEAESLPLLAREGLWLTAAGAAAIELVRVWRRNGTALPNVPHGPRQIG